MSAQTSSTERQIRQAGRQRKRVLDQLATVEVQLRQAITEAWPEIPHRKLADLAGVSHGTVQNWIRASQGGDN
jgi:transposase-like protein